MVVFMLKGLEGSSPPYGDKSLPISHVGAVQARQLGEQALLLGRALANPHNLANLICKAQMRELATGKYPGPMLSTPNAVQKW